MMIVVRKSERWRVRVGQACSSERLNAAAATVRCFRSKLEHFVIAAVVTPSALCGQERILWGRSPHASVASFIKSLTIFSRAASTCAACCCRDRSTAAPRPLGVQALT